MDNGAILARLEALSEALLLAEPSDVDIYAKAREEFTCFAAWADEHGFVAPAQALRGASSLIERLIVQDVQDPSSAADVINLGLSVFQRVVRDGESADGAEFPAELLGASAGHTPPDPEDLSPSCNMDAPIDRSLLSEFLGHAASVLSDLEPLVIEGEQHPSARIVGQVRREVHTLKAEAAFVGLNQISGVLHALEDAIDRLDAESLPGGTLEVIDWIQRGIAARKGTGPNPGSPEPLLAQLCEVPRAPGAEVSHASGHDTEPLDAGPELLREFVVEAREHLENADVHLLNIESNDRDADALNAVFRAFHTIKGVAGFLSLDQIQALAHEAENLLEKARKGDFELRGNYIDAAFDAVDTMKRLVSDVEHALASGEGLAPDRDVASLVEHLKSIVTGRCPLNPGDALHIEGPRMRIGEILESGGMTTRGAVEKAVSRQAHAETLPLGELLVREVVISRKQLDQALAIQASEGNTRRLGEILASSGMARLDDINRAVGKQFASPIEPVGATLVRTGDVSAKEVAHALRGQRQQQSPVDVREAVKVDAERLDKLVDLIGELVIAESMVSQSGELTRNISQQLSRQISQLNKITRELQEIGMSLRMVPVRGTFQKMSRLVRDLAKKSGKLVEFATEGDETELDKTVVDRIGDPLVHMVRNAVDHGIEATSTDRVAAGKPAIGRVTLRAFHKGGCIFVEIEDDGRGLDRDAILAKGKERGLVRDNDVLSDREIFGLIFEPGFTTAKQVTDVSGRGVGMDVVRRNIETLRGQVDIQSDPGKGSVFSIRLPLTLAIIDGMVIRVGRERYIVPTLSVLRTIKPEPGHLASVVNRGEMLTLHGQLIPLIRLHSLFGIAHAKTDPMDAIVLILEDEGKRVGLMVDELLGQQQIVIKSLGDAMKGVQGVAGGAIMGDGTVGLIVDVGGVVRLAQVGSGAPDTRVREPAA